MHATLRTALLFIDRRPETPVDELPATTTAATLRCLDELGHIEARRNPRGGVWSLGSSRFDARELDWHSPSAAGPYLGRPSSWDEIRAAGPIPDGGSPAGVVCEWLVRCTAAGRQALERSPKPEEGTAPRAVEDATDLPALSQNELCGLRRLAEAVGRSLEVQHLTAHLHRETNGKVARRLVELGYARRDGRRGPLSITPAGRDRAAFEAARGPRPSSGRLGIGIPPTTRPGHSV